MNAVVFPGVDPVAVLDGSVWGRFGAEPEYPACRSVLRMLNGQPNRSAACVVLHAETGETAHCAQVNGHDVFWTDREAEVAEAWLGILSTCSRCGARYRQSDCGPYCRKACQLADKHSPADDYDVESEAA